MRSSVNLRAYGQRDPLVEYKKEGLRLFKEMESATIAQILKMLPLIGAVVQLKNSPVAKRLAEVHEQAQVIGSGDAESNKIHQAKPHEKTADGQKVGRNDDCPCGSGKKYKKCHGQ